MGIIIGSGARKGVAEKISNFYQAALDAVFPEFCVICKKEGEFFCVECRGSANIDLQAKKCPFCKRETGSGITCRRCSRVASLDGCIALSHYAEPAVKGIIKQWKYSFNEKSKEHIASWIRRSNLKNVLVDFPWQIVPVSLHAARKRERGFDQAEEIAKMMSGELGYPISRTLIRKKKTTPQAGSGQKRRMLGELSGAFRVVARPPSYVLLCDDVLTSGATLDAAAEALKLAGSEMVWGLVLARGK